MSLLASRFPNNIALFETRDAAGDVLAGVWMFDFGHVVHSQYIASGKRGRELGALDLLFEHLIRVEYADRQFFSFGTSNENEGRILNEGLVRQKIMFGGRGVVYQSYRLRF